MLNTYQINTLAKEMVEERIEDRRFDGLLRNLRVRQVAQRNLRREVERLLKADGNTQSVLDVLEKVAAKTRTQAGCDATTACCS